MTVGQTARRLLGPRGFSCASRIYRRVFVDLSKVAAAIGPLESGARVLDIGGGDGHLVNRLLELNPGVRVSMIDIASSVGNQVSDTYRDRVAVFPGVSVAEYARQRPIPPDVILVSDVLHHIPSAERRSFFEDIRDLMAGQTCRLILKDMEPGHLRTYLSGLADRYVSGDKRVQFPSRRAVTDLVQAVFPGARCSETDLFCRDRPNYCLIFTTEGAAPRPGRT
jgi:2-polyprenyl-3-methyl-5-hydroxy-6-metoxy-1,4-benzoquinol methylase